MAGAAAVQLYKNNIDNKGASDGHDDNRLMSRATPAVGARHTGFLVTARRLGRGWRQNPGR
jgi:Pup amidohydrolase